MNRLASLARAAAPLASRVMGAAPFGAPVAGAGVAAAEAAAAAGGAAVCGRGDKRTAKGKRFKHSNGAARAR
jgi:ribosomal small subunit protein bTHX